MTTYAQLEIGLHKREDTTYDIDVRFSKPDSDAEIAPARGSVAIDFDTLREHHLKPQVYGESLSAAVFKDDDINKLYNEAKVAVESTDLHLRVRLLIGPSAAELNSLRWELMTDPATKLPLATSERVLFSRFMLSQDWRPIKLRPKAELRALVAVAAPTNLVSKWKLPEIDVTGEIQRATEALGQLGSGQIEVLGDNEPVTLDNLVDGLRDGVDILYLVCHGAKIPRKGPHLWLADEGGQCKTPTAGDQLAMRLNELPHLPRLMVLASCESAGAAAESTSETKGDVASLAPRLAQAGVPAILAMQGKITMETVKEAMPLFFSELVKDGQIDRAMAVARGRVCERPDSWMPALFLRIKGGRIWYVPGFEGDEEDFEKSAPICDRVRKGTFIPILGPDLGEQVFGSSRDLAQALAEKHKFPLRASDSSDLAKVIQQLGIHKDHDYARGQVEEQLRRQLLNRNPDVKDDDGAKRPLAELLDVVAERQSHDDNDPYRILAHLPAKLYINASAETLLFKSLKQAGRSPTPLLCDWRPTDENPSPKAPKYPYDGRQPKEPTEEIPIVYQIFGVHGRPDSLVLTEDDFFDFTVRASFYKLIPGVVSGLLTQGSLPFLGFALNDWKFRVLFRLIMTMEGCGQLRQFSHVGVQIDPEEHSVDDVEWTRKCLKEYFRSDRSGGRGRAEPKIDIYWGTSADFLLELNKQLAKAKTDDGEELVPATPGDQSAWF